MGIRLIWTLMFLGVFLLMGASWQLLELLFYSEIQPRFVDDVIGLVLAASITLNISKYIKIE